MADPVSDVSVPSLDSACSASCTKAGITALVFSVLALSLIPRLTQVDALTALSTYVGSRIALKTVVDALDADPCWQELLRTEPGIEKRISVARLKERHCGYMAEGKIAVVDIARRETTPRADVLRPPKMTPPPASRSDQGPPAPPVAPVGLMLLFSPQPLDEIEQALLALGQRDTLTLARSLFQFRFGWSIHRWERRAVQLNSRTDANDNRPQVYDSKNYRFHEHLTLADVKLLAAFEYLEPSIIEQVFTEQTRITLPNAGSPISLGTSTGLVEFGLLVSLIYFWLYQREVRFSPTFPAAGSIFAVFARTRASRNLFVSFVSAPARCAVLLAWWSPAYVKAVSYALALVVVLFCILIARQAAHLDPRGPKGGGR